MTDGKNKTNNKMSSGAEKAEKLADKKQTKSTAKSVQKDEQAEENSSAIKKEKAQSKNKAGKKTAVNAQSKKLAKGKKNKTLSEKAKKKREKRAEAALLRAQRKQEMLDKKAERKQLRLDKKAERKERALEKRQEKLERKQLLKSKTKQQLKELKLKEKQARLEERQAKREAAASERQAKREHKLKLRAERRERENDRRHAPGFGGWLAAVISLGVTSMVLATIVTFGWMNMSGMQAAMAGVQVQSLYELNSIVDNLDTNLAKARVTSSSADSVRVLSDIATESEMAEVILERLPVDITLTEEMSAFINKMGDSAKSMLYTVAANGELTPSQQQWLQYMYEANLAIKRELNQIVAKTNGADMLAALRGKSGIITESFTNIQNNVIETPKGIQDGPFADSKENIGDNALSYLKEITAPDAEKLAKEYFADYKITAADCRGEAVANSISVYNVELKSDNGDMLAQISKAGGKLVMFDSYKDCADKNFSVERCEQIALDFLAKLGYEDLKAVWTSENGTTCNLNFAPVSGGVVLYPDLIKVKVCEQRGLVTGLEAISYCLNHIERNIAKATLSQEEAQSVINGNINVKIARAALIPFDGEEVLTYEFYGELDGGEYYIYVDATTGEEIEVLTVIGTAQGRALM